MIQESRQAIETAHSENHQDASPDLADRLAQSTDAQEQQKLKARLCDFVFAFGPVLWRMSSRCTHKHEYEREESEAYMQQAILKVLGLTLDDARRTLESDKKAIEEARLTFRGEILERVVTLEDPLAQGNYSLGEKLELAYGCKDITVKVCKRYVCISQPIPLTVYDVTAASGSDGSFATVAGGTPSQFSYSDEVNGTSSWNACYHRHHKIHEGAISVAANGVLVESARVLALGTTFEPLPHRVGIRTDRHLPIGTIE